MSKFNALRSRAAYGLASSVFALTLAALPAVVHAQDVDSENADADKEIIVTGTLVRGIAPAGTSVVGVTAEAVEASGATTVTELLTDVPQFGSFNNIQTLSGGGNFVTTNRPNLRSLPGFTTTGTSGTLMMVDGARVVGMGIASTTPDADFIPPAIIQRVDIIPDGGSALYGSDAVAGVVNFITIKRFDGLKADARYGFGDEFHTFDANVTVGKTWDRGSVWLSYNYAENSNILGKDRSYNFTPQARVDGVILRDLECSSPNLRVAASPGGATTLYSALSASAANSANQCDLSDEADMYPEQKRHSVYAGLNWELSDRVELDVRAFYYRKESTFGLGQYSSSINIGPSFLAAFGFVSSPYSVNLTGSPVETKAVNFALGPNFLNYQSVVIDTWGFRPTLTAQLGDNWRLRTTFGYSQSKNESHNPRILPTALLGPLVASGQFNPFAPLTANAATLAALTNWETYGKADQSQLNLRAIVDGDLFELPSGAVKVALGAEYIRETYDSRKGDVVPANFASLNRFEQTRNVASVFGEIVAPIFGKDGGPSLNVSAAGRYDHYNDFGGTFNPKFGATFKVIDGLSFRGAWGKSFVAPSLADSAVADPTGLNWIEGATLNFIAPPNVLAANGFPAVGAGQKIMFLLGANPGLQPQKSQSWTIGVDIAPSGVPGLKVSATYYNLSYNNIISLIPFIDQNLFFSTFARNGAFTLNPTQAQIDAVVGQAATTVGAPCAPQPSCVYGIQDVRKRNQLRYKQDGLDFSLDYRTDTSFGSVDFSVAGNYIFNRKNSPGDGLPFTPEIQYSKLGLRTQVGANIGNFRAQATWNHSKGFPLSSPQGLGGQTSVGSFNTVDLFFRYEFAGESILKDLALTFNINNAFDQEPPIYTGGDIVRNQRGFRNGNTLGRIFQVGVSKKF
ncbi:MAG: TonB-dependent receptor [Novosphingobium sp.]